MEIQIAVAKVHKYAVSESGDTVEVIERPGGGLSVVLVDGQSSGRGAKHVSNLVARKVVSLLAEGVRDGAAARAASDSLFVERGGRVSATLNIFSVDFRTRTLVITRNNPAPVLLFVNGQTHMLESECKPVGLYANTRPWIIEHDIQPNLTAVMYTDGLIHAGKRRCMPMDVAAVFEELMQDEPAPPQWVADSLLEHALRLDENRPADDISVVVIGMRHQTDESPIRRMQVRLPVPLVL
ncbi:MAG: SpoIIE family protein phosphatase [Anaerolineales bacterium]